MRTLRQAACMFSAALFLCFLCAPLPAQVPAIAQSPAAEHPNPKQALRASERGAKAEAAGRVEEALVAYQEAALLAPQDTAIVERAAALRSKLVRIHTAAAERDALAGHMDQATEELAAALRIDRGDTIVAERLAQMRTMADEPPRKPATEISGLPKLQPLPEKHNLDLRGDTKTVYEQAAAAFGIKAVFDPDLSPRTVRLRLDDMDFFTAVSILSAQKATFWRPVNPTLIFVAPDTLEKRRQYAPEAQQTFPLSGAASPEDVTEMLRVLREMTGATHIELDTRSRTITIRDTPERLAVAGELIRQVEKARGEVMLEIELLEVDRDTARKLGVQTPPKAQLFTIPPNLISQLTQANNLSELQTLLAGIFGTAANAGATSVSSLIPPLVAVGGGKTTFLLTLPGAALDFSNALSLVHSGRQVLLRAQDGKPATFFVGDRFPVTLALLSGSLGTSSALANPGGASNPFPSTSYAVGVGPVALLAADFQNNGILDIAAVNQLDNSVTILVNQSGSPGSFVEATNSPISLGAARTAAPANAPAIASAVLTSSGFHDLLITDPTANDVKILFSNGDDTFKTPATSLPVGTQPSAIVTADFDGDGHQDFAVANFADSTLSVFLGGVDTNGNSTFTPVAGSPFALPANFSGPVAMTVADFNADGKPDIAIVNQTTLANPSVAQGNVVVLQGNGDGTFTQFPGSPIAVGQNPVAIASGDLDGNASADLAVVNKTDNSVTVLLNNGDATFVAGPNSPVSTATNPTGIAIADFNQDGHADFAVTGGDTNTFRVFFGVAAGLFTLGFEPPAGPSGSTPTAIVTAQLVSGGFPDVAITNNVTGAAGDVTVVLSPASLFSSSGLTQQPYPASEYIDLGVTLQLEFEIRALSGSSVNGIPIISNRTLTQTVRVKEDEPTLIGGLTDTEETRAITGLPGFAEIPGAGYAFGQRNNSLQ